MNVLASRADLNALTPNSEYLSDNASIASEAVSYSPDFTALYAACENSANLPKPSSITSASIHLSAREDLKFLTVTSPFLILPNSSPTEISDSINCLELTVAPSIVFQS